MEENKAFCEQCRKDVEYIVTKQKETANLLGNQYAYDGKIAHCKDCGSEIYVGEINDSNLKALYNVYHAQNKNEKLEEENQKFQKSLKKEAEIIKSAKWVETRKEKLDEKQKIY